MAAGAAALAVASCGGGGGSRVAPTTTSETPVATTAPTSNTTLGPASVSPSRPAPGPGSVAFTVLGAPVSDPGLRVLMGPVEGLVKVVVGGLPEGPGGVEVCPVRGVSGSPGTGRCVVATSDRTVDLTVDGGVDGGPAGVLLRPVGGSSSTPIRVPEVTFTYRPDGDSVTIVTPPLPPPGTPGDCPGGACEMTFEVVPTARGTFELAAEGRNARPQLTLRSGRDGAGGARTVAIVEGGGRLRMSATVEGPEDVSLVLRNLGSEALPALELALVWPVVR